MFQYASSIYYSAIGLCTQMALLIWAVLLPWGVWLKENLPESRNYSACHNCKIYAISDIFFFLLAHSHIVVVDMLSCVQLSSILWPIACQAPLSMEFSRQEYWSGLPFPPPEDLPDAGIEPESSVAPALQIDFLPAEPWGSLSCVDPGFLPNNLATLLWRVKDTFQRWKFLV